MTRISGSRIAVSAVVLLSTVIPATRAVADCPDTTVDAQAVSGLIGATDVTSLDARYSQLGSHDLAVIAVYRKRRLDLNPTKREESKYVASLPATAEELSRVYKLVDSRDLCGNEYVSDVFYGMFERAAKLAKKHAAGHEAYIRRCLLTDGEVAEFSWDWFDWLLENDTARTVAAIRELSLEDQKRICGDTHLERVSLEEARKKCASGQ